jgi:protein-L-isoaspartate(D-aspartate) O-methyltransferase
MVARLLEPHGIEDERVLRAMREIPRHRFVDEALAAKAYGEHALPIGQGQTLSQPRVVAAMTQILGLGPTDAVLEIGTGSGYHAAVLSRVAARVFTVERIPELSERARQLIRSLSIENVHFKVFDGTYGWSEFAPYAGIVVTAASPEVPSPLVDQLAPGGHLVMPVGEGREQELVSFHKDRDGMLHRREHGAVSFVPLVGRYGLPG